MDPQQSDQYVPPSYATLESRQSADVVEIMIERLRTSPDSIFLLASRGLMLQLGDWLQLHRIGDSVYIRLRGPLP